MFAGAYADRRVLLTGHTGFKGSWLSLWLMRLGAQLTGAALDPDNGPNHWDLLQLDMDDRRVDLTDASAARALVADACPEMVFHFAAQSLVRRSYADPLGTWNANVMGTANLLEACRAAGGVKAVVVVTTDKCYENREWAWGYRENDRLGGHDPYSASKAAVELVAASFRNAFFSDGRGPLVATARAGNVIGGGDWCTDRLVPDAVGAMSGGPALAIRSPRSTRPWQHVLEPLAGYLLLGQRLLQGRAEFAEAWNFGPESEGQRTVADLLQAMHGHWPALTWTQDDGPKPHEAGLLNLDCSKAREVLGWRPVTDFGEAVALTVRWYRAWLEEGHIATAAQLEDFERLAAERGAVWALERA